MTDRLALPSGDEADLPRGRGWDLLILCLCVYMLTSVARLHQLFPVLSLVRPVAVAGLLAIGAAVSWFGLRERSRAAVSAEARRATEKPGPAA